MQRSYDAHRHKRQAIQRCSVDSTADKQTCGNSQAGRQGYYGGRMNVVIYVDEEVKAELEKLKEKYSAISINEVIKILLIKG